MEHVLEGGDLWVVLVVRAHGGPAEGEVHKVATAIPGHDLNIVHVLWEDDNDVVGGGVLKETSAPGLGLIPQEGSLQAAVKEHDRLAVVASLAGMRNVDVANITEMGLSLHTVLNEWSLIEGVEITEQRVIQLPLFQSLVGVEGLQHVVSHVVATVSEATFSWWLECLQ